MYQPYPGSAQLPEVQRPAAPAPVRNAVKVMYAGAVASVLGIAVGLATIGATKNAIERHSPAMSASQVSSTGHALVAGSVIGGLVAAAAWIVIARSCRSGGNWARITGTVLFAIATVDTFAGIAAPIAGLVKIWGVVVWLAGLAAVVLLWQRASTAFFKQDASS